MKGLVFTMAYEIRLAKGGRQKPLQIVESNNGLPKVGDKIRIFHNAVSMKNYDLFDCMHTDYTVVDVYHTVGFNSDLRDIVVVDPIPKDQERVFF